MHSIYLSIFAMCSGEGGLASLFLFACWQQASDPQAVSNFEKACRKEDLGYFLRVINFAEMVTPDAEFEG